MELGVERAGQTDGWAAHLGGVAIEDVHEGAVLPEGGLHQLPHRPQLVLHGGFRV